MKNIMYCIPWYLFLHLNKNRPSKKIDNNYYSDYVFQPYGFFKYFLFENDLKVEDNGMDIDTIIFIAPFSSWFDALIDKIINSEGREHLKDVNIKVYYTEQLNIDLTEEINGIDFIPLKKNKLIFFRELKQNIAKLDVINPIFKKYSLEQFIVLGALISISNEQPKLCSNYLDGYYFDTKDGSISYNFDNERLQSTLNVLLNKLIDILPLEYLLLAIQMLIKKSEIIVDNENNVMSFTNLHKFENILNSIKNCLKDESLDLSEIKKDTLSKLSNPFFICPFCKSGSIYEAKTAFTCNHCNLYIEKKLPHDMKISKSNINKLFLKGSLKKTKQDHILNITLKDEKIEIVESLRV